MSAKIIEMKTGTFDNGALAAICVDTDGESCWYYCVEQDELCLLVKDSNAPEEICATIDCESLSDLECFSVVQKSMCVSQKAIDNESLLEFFMENDFEKYECWKNDGYSGVAEAAEESEFGKCFVLAFKLWSCLCTPFQVEYLGIKDFDEIGDRNLDEEAFKLFIEETPSVDEFDMDSWLMEGRW